MAFGRTRATAAGVSDVSRSDVRRVLVRALCARPRWLRRRRRHLAQAGGHAQRAASNRPCARADHADPRQLPPAIRSPIRQSWLRRVMPSAPSILDGSVVCAPPASRSISISSSSGCSATESAETATSTSRTCEWAGRGALRSRRDPGQAKAGRCARPAVMSTSTRATRTTCRASRADG